MAGRIEPALLVLVLVLVLGETVGLKELASTSPYLAASRCSHFPWRLSLRGGEEIKLSKTMEVLWDRANAARMLQENMHNGGSEDAKKLKHLVDEIKDYLKSTSALLRHEVCYALGQTGSSDAVPTLSRILQDRTEEAIVRHEAAEALAAIGDEECQPLLVEMLHDPCPEVADTCTIAIDRMKWQREKKGEVLLQNSEFVSVDPAPAFEKKETQPERQFAWISQAYLDKTKSLFDRYRALFSLRNIGGHDAVKVICQGLMDPNALFRHEVAFVLGQMSDPEALHDLQSVLEDTNENSMVRHEAAEAIGGMGLVECRDLLERFLKDSNPIVSQSCEVALDMTAYWKDFKEARV